MADTLREIMVGNLDEGIFRRFSENLFSRNTVIFNDENIYKLNVDVPQKNLNFSAETELVNGAGLIFDFYQNHFSTQWI